MKRIVERVQLVIRGAWCALGRTSNQGAQLDRRARVAFAICGVIGLWVAVGKTGALGVACAGIGMACVIAAATTSPFRKLLVVASVLICFPPMGLGWLFGPVAYAPWYLFLRRTARAVDAAKLGFILGAAHGFVLHLWIAHSLAWPTTVMICVSACGGVWWSIASVGVWVLLHRRIAICSIAAVAVLPLIEWCRIHVPSIPLPYNCTAHMVASNLYLAQAVEAIGVDGLSVLLCTIGLGTALSIDKHDSHDPAPQIGSTGGPARGVGLRFLRAGRAWPSIILLLISLMLAHAAGAWRIFSIQRARLSFPNRSFKAAVVQEFRPRHGSDEVEPDGRGNRLAAEIRLALNRTPVATLILPESAIYVPAEAGASGDPLTLGGLARLLRGSRNSPPCISGVLIDIPGSNSGIGTVAAGYRNTISLIVARKDGVDVPDSALISESCDKLVLAPVGESVPFEGWPLLERLGRTISQNDVPLVSPHTAPDLQLPDGTRAAVAVCFEQMFPDIWYRRGIHRAGPYGSANPLQGIDFQLVCADERWFGYSPVERAQSRAARRLLAIRYRTALLYAAEGGSEWFSETGRLEAQAEPTDPYEIWDLSLPSPDARIMIHRWASGPAWMVYAALGTALAAVMAASPRRR